MIRNKKSAEDEKNSLLCVDLPQIRGSCCVHEGNSSLAVPFSISVTSMKRGVGWAVDPLLRDKRSTQSIFLLGGAYLACGVERRFFLCVCFLVKNRSNTFLLRGPEEECPEQTMLLLFDTRYLCQSVPFGPDGVCWV